MECPMCMDLYDSQEKIPRNMNCGHTVCEERLMIVYEKKRFLDCPTCRYKHDPQLKPSLLTKNFIALQLACQKKQTRKNYQFCPVHDQPYKFYCQTDNHYLCVECIVEHTGHHFTKQDKSFFTTKKQLNDQIRRLEEERKILCKFESEYSFVKEQLIKNYESTTGQLDRIFNIIKNKLADQHYKSKEELRHFLEKQLKELQQSEQELLKDLQVNQKEKERVSELLAKVEREKKVEDVYEASPTILRKHERPAVVEFPVMMIPFQGTENFVQICHKMNPKICLFGEKKKLLTFCPLTNIYSLTTISNCEIQYYASACTLPTGQIFITGGGSSNCCYLFSPRDPNVLEKKKGMLNARKEHSCVYMNGKVYVISGYDGKNKGMAGCECYDIFKEEWRAIKGLNTPRCAFAAIVTQGKIYVFGGYDGKERLNLIQVYNPESNTWTTLTTKIEFPLSNAAAVADGKYIYILGGGWSEGFNQDVFRFNVESHEIERYQRMKNGRDLRNKAIKFKNSIYSLGGNFYDGERLELRSSEWSDLKPYNDLVTDNLDSWCCALSYSSHQDELQKYQEMSKVLLQFKCQRNSKIQEPQGNME